MSATLFTLRIWLLRKFSSAQALGRSLNVSGIENDIRASVVIECNWSLNTLRDMVLVDLAVTPSGFGEVIKLYPMMLSLFRCDAEGEPIVSSLLEIGDHPEPSKYELSLKPYNNYEMPHNNYMLGAPP
ncbi:hypothetical protein POX_c04560 [Penicillium oxalicum]|uniref:hypothetical protein n=1 Tax=Penicillium oxalicum TaxID=69781 RepID=UPI0020B7FD62|nr:hypothetical protein POX_c04560 [Penicillium oxalicum]KAI2791691.1 hypothetical protein POX_c04560 [Penicillium oxalicum]